MNDFLISNFLEFKKNFEKDIGFSLAKYVENNISVMDNSISKKVVELPKWFLAKCLLKYPEDKIVNKCNQLFSKTKNLNRRTPHEYACNQVAGFLNEVLHYKKLQLKYPDKQVTLNGSEFNALTKKRELYCDGFGKRDADIKILSDGSNESISVKSNATFSKNPQITFRGKSKTKKGIPEIDLIKKQEHDVHILFYNKDKYLSLSSAFNNKECIESEFYLPSSNDWGNEGAYRIKFKNNIFDYSVYY